ncbi:fibrillarin-like rRNA/tRNA 2'-O-methyltransferase [Candidatus Micrarchaeota archaeon]|nr:fibrillarin-like rRNA/tRNA 2'-O-methyltransferase [Candidatus Micrarchaeota archaeon]
MSLQTIFPGVYSIHGQPYTRSLTPGFKVHGEKTVKNGGHEYRNWAPQHSKLSAAIVQGLKDFPYQPGSKILYLGAAQGVTCSFLSDVIGPTGEIFGVEISKRALRDLIFVCEKRTNIYPILADASQPQEYAADVGQVDVVFEDVAAREQDAILARNAAACLKVGGFAMLAIKARSIDSAADPNKIYEKVITNIQADPDAHLELVQQVRLDPYETDHMFAVFVKKK